LIGAVDSMRQGIVVATLPLEGSLDYNAHLLCRLLPRGSTVLTYDHWWSLGGDHTVYEPGVGRGHWDEIEYVVAGAEGVRPPQLQTYVKEHFRPIHDNRSASPPKLFGVTLSRTCYRGFGAVVFARSAAPAHSRRLGQTEGIRPGGSRTPAF